MIGNGGLVAGFVISGIADTYTELPTPASDYSDELWMVRNGSGGFLSIINVYKYPSGLYIPNASDIWEQIPLNVKVTEDSTTLINITNWSEFISYNFDMNIGDRIIFNDITYKNLTGNQTGTSPDSDATNWEIAEINKSLSNLEATSINRSLIPDTTNLYDIGSNGLRWKNGYFSDVMTVYDLVVESGSSIKLAGATFENKGHYTSVDTNWIVEHDDQDTAFIGVYANSEGIMTHANLVLEAQGSAFNLLKNSPLHPSRPNDAEVFNEGNYSIFVDHDSEISWNHFTELTKDEYGNITNMTGMQSLMRLTDDFLLLEDVGLKVNSILIVDDAGILQETDPVFSASPSVGILAQDIINWDEAYDWGDHAAAGYLTSETDPVFSAWESSFTQGSIIFADASGLIENNDNLFWDNVNKRLGIGLADPARMVHMQGRNATFRIDRDTNSPAVQMHHFPTGDFTTPLKGFIFGVSASGVDDGIFFISDFHQAVGGGGDNRFTIENDGKITIPGALDIGGIISGDGSGLTNLSESQITDLTHFTTEDETDPIFVAWNRSDGILITESQISDLSHTPAFDGDIPEIYNSLGLFKIQPDVQGDVEVFGDTDVDNAENSKIFKIWRRAAEGNDYIRFYISANKTAYIHASNVLTLQAQNPFVINSVTQDITFKVGDNAGAKKSYFKDSDNVTVASIDSNGWLWIDANMGGGLEINRGSQNNIKTYMDWQYTDIRFSGDKDFNRIGTWIDKPFQIVTDSVDRMVIDKYGRVEMTNSLTVNSDITVMDDILAYGDVAARNHVVRRAVVFEDNSTQTEAGERQSSQGHTHTAIYNNDWYDTSAENMSQRDLHFSPDGLMLYIIGLANSGAGDCYIWEYPLTIPWDLSTVGTPTIENIETYGSNQVGLFIDIDGRRLWTVCTSNDTVIEYSMNSWNILSLQWVQAKDISGQVSAPSALSWSRNGDRLFVADAADANIVAFSIVNEWDIAGLSWFQDFETDIDAPTGLDFSSDGRRMYVMDGSAEDDIHEFHLSSPWMIESARLVNLFNVSAENSSPQGIFLTPDNSKIFMVGTSTPDGVYGYDLGSEVKGNIIGGTFKAENMPTSDPIDAGALWNDSGAVKISAG